MIQLTKRSVSYISDFSYHWLMYSLIKSDNDLEPASRFIKKTHFIYLDYRENLIPA